MASSETSIAIIGAGIGGLSLASALSRHGLAASIFEQRAALIEDGFGLNIQPAAVEVLFHLGLRDVLLQAGIATRAHRYLTSDGELVYEEPRGRAYGAAFPQLSILRSDLSHALAAGVKRFSPVFLSHRLTKDAFGDGPSPFGAYDLVVGADGIHSQVRAALFPDAMGLRESDTILWRGLTPMPAFVDGRTLIIVNDPNGARLIAYPVGSPSALANDLLINWVLVVPRHVEQAAIDASGGLVGAGLVAHIAKDWRLDVVDVARLAGDASRLLRAPMVDRDPIGSWSGANMVLLGDAAHPMYPIGAHGASQAILDAFDLAGSLAAERTTTAAVKAYEARRIAATARIVEAARTMNRREIAGSALPAAARASEIQATTEAYHAVTAQPHALH